MPGCGRGDGELERGLEVGLLKNGEYATRVGNLKLRIEVNLVVDGVDKAMKTLTCVCVGEVRIDLEHV